MKSKSLELSIPFTRKCNANFNDKQLTMTFNSIFFKIHPQGIRLSRRVFIRKSCLRVTDILVTACIRVCKMSRVVIYCSIDIRIVRRDTDITVKHGREYSVQKTRKKEENKIKYIATQFEKRDK